jgi:hypothetical protein
MIPSNKGQPNGLIVGQQRPETPQHHRDSARRRASNGTGFGDGKEISSRLVPLGGTGFWGDLALLAGTILIDVLAIFVWYYVMSRLDNLGADDPVAPDDRQLDLNDPASWYIVQVPG